MRHLQLGAGAVLLLAACSMGSGSPAASTSSPQGSADATTYTTVVKAVGPSVVEIQTASGLGSGVVFDGQGDVVTNAHVIGDEQRLTVISSEGKQLNATLVGSYPPDDLAVIRVSGGNLKPARWADSAKAVVGQVVLAIGSPLGLQSSVTQGIVSATNRVVSEGSGITLPDTIQTSAAINPGNSGGALVEMDQTVLGIPTLAALVPGNGAPAPGIGFAISSNRASDIASQLVQYGRVVNSHRAYLGVQTVPTTSDGVLVVGLVAGGPADKASIRVGDLITSVAGTPTPTPGDLSKVLATKAPGNTVEVALVRADGGRATVQATLGELPGA
ncbi:MAG TPA: trypsin-like peptidase domain-containing protein [Candidatus Dormibacteraeota bacterium]